MKSPGAAIESDLGIRIRVRPPAARPVVRVHIVFAHPSHDSFTGRVLGELLRGLAAAGHVVTLSDLYASGFNPVMSREQYVRETRYSCDLPVPEDVAREQARLDAAQVWVFVYPVWWTDCPAILKGWFDRVWSVGYAYAPGQHDISPQLSARRMKVAEKAMVVCTAGHTVEALRDSGCYDAMYTTMIDDRLAGRARQTEFHVLAGSSDLPPADWVAHRLSCLTTAFELGRDMRYRTYLEMNSPDWLVPARGDRPVTMKQIEGVEVRALTQEVGRPWGWHRAWGAVTWAEHLGNPTLRHYRLEVGGQPVGVATYNLENWRTVEIDSFGLLPQVIGHGLGGPCLTETVRRAWADGATRVWLHTSTADHPNALPNYLARGFRPFDPLER